MVHSNLKGICHESVYFLTLILKWALQQKLRPWLEPSRYNHAGTMTSFLDRNRCETDRVDLSCACAIPFLCTNGRFNESSTSTLACVRTNFKVCRFGTLLHCRLERLTVRVMTVITSKLIFNIERSENAEGALYFVPTYDDPNSQNKIWHSHLHLQAVRSRLKLFRMRSDWRKEIGLNPNSENFSQL